MFRGSYSRSNDRNAADSGFRCAIPYIHTTKHPGLISWRPEGSQGHGRWGREAPDTRLLAWARGGSCAGVQDSHCWALNKSHLASHTSPTPQPTYGQVSEMSIKIKTKCSVAFSIILKSPRRCGLLLLQGATKRSTGPQSWLGMSGSPYPATLDWPTGSQLCDFGWSFRTGSALHWVSGLRHSGRVPFRNPLKLLWELLLCLSIGPPFLFGWGGPLSVLPPPPGAGPEA